MKAFLSHSSKDKGFVENVVTVLRPGTYELDAQTFDFGLINSQAIIKALESCDLYCLFLSSQSVNSSYVDFETHAFKKASKTRDISMLCGRACLPNLLLGLYKGT